MAWNSDDMWKLFRPAMWVGAGLLLLLPAVAMQFTTEVRWDAEDFVAMGVMLLLACGSIESALRASADSAYRLGAIVAVAAAFLLLWVNLAVGIIGSEDNPANLLYLLVLGTLIGGWSAGSGDPRRMARGLIAAAAMQALIGTLAFAGQWAAQEPPGHGGILAINLSFVALWCASALLFSRARRAHIATA